MSEVQVVCTSVWENFHRIFITFIWRSANRSSAALDFICHHLATFKLQNFWRAFLIWWYMKAVNAQIGIMKVY